MLMNTVRLRGRFCSMLMCCLIAGLAPVLPSVLSSTVGAAQAEPKPLAFRNVRIFDGVTAIPRGNVVVQDGKILAAGSGANIPDGAEVIEGEGLTLIPGLIDSHTHSYGDALKTALVFGVTTELDMFTDYHMAPAIRKQQSEGKAKNVADLFSAGTLVTAPHGHGTEYGLPIPTINGPEEAQAFCRRPNSGRLGLHQEHLRRRQDLRLVNPDYKQSHDGGSRCSRAQARKARRGAYRLASGGARCDRVGR
jgi:hypothetical protein